MRHRIMDDRLEMDPTRRGYWGGPSQAVVWGRSQRITWTHARLVEERMLASGAMYLDNMMLLVTTWIARLPIAAVVVASRCNRSRDEVPVAAPRHEREGRWLISTLR